VVADQLHRALVEHLQVFVGQTEQSGDDPGGELEGEIPDQVGFTGVDEFVDQRVADRPHNGGLPPGQCFGLECRGHQIAMIAMLLSLHRQDGGPHEQADCLVVRLGAEHPAVPEHSVDRVERHRRVLPLRHQRLGRLGVIHDGAAENAGLPALMGEERVGVAQTDGFVAGAGGGVNVGRHLVSNIVTLNGQCFA